MTDPISDFLTRLRNASKARLRRVRRRRTRSLKEDIAAILKAEGYIADYATGADADGPQDPRREDEVRGRRARHHAASSASPRPAAASITATPRFPRVLNGLGIAIVSTPKGLMKDTDCRRQKAGGELICNVW